VEPPPEALKQGKVRTISHRIAVRMEGRGELETYDWRDARGQVDRQGAGFAPLRTLDAVLAYAHLACDLADAQSPCRASIGQLVAEAMAKHPAPLCS
jgi:hypothetical protein